MIPGIKLGPNTWKLLTKQYKPKACEVWFRIDWSKRYEEMFLYLKTENILTGLHFWGILNDGIMPNFVLPDKDIRKPSLNLVKQTIDIANKNGFTYVVIHPGSYRLSSIDLEKLYMRPVKGSEISSEKGNEILFENISSLHEYANKQNICLYIETMPLKEPMNWKDFVKGRQHTQNMRNVPVAIVQKLADKDFYICNDLCHTACDVVSNNRETLFSQLFNKTKRLASQTRLIHINTMPPPFNGTDAHNGIRKADFDNNVFPSRDQLKQIIKLFLDREDVWAIPEPYDHHIENTKSLIELIEEVNVVKANKPNSTQGCLRKGAVRT